jgi:hypothetical protein
VTDPTYDGIRGWLLFLAIGVFAAPIASVWLAFGFVLRDDLSSGVAYGLLGVYQLYAVAELVRKSCWFPRIQTFSLLGQAAINLVIPISDEPAVALGNAASAAVWCLYLLKSRRVQSTFSRAAG